MPVKIDEEYCIEKVEAYNVAIEALRQHEGADDVHGLSSLLREKLAAKLDKLMPGARSIVSRTHLLA